MAECHALKDIKTYLHKNRGDYAFLVEGRDGWLFRSRADLKDNFAVNPDSLSYLKRLHKTLAGNGTQLIMVPVPTRGIVHYDYLNPESAAKFDHQIAFKNYLEFLSDLRGTGILVPDMSEVDHAHSFFWKDDSHWSEQGAKFTAEKIKDLIKDQSALQQIDSVDFHSVLVEAKTERKRKYLDFYNELCDPDLAETAAEKATQTERTQSVQTETDLFADETVPQIVLIGTSNSTNPPPSFANFEGFLKEVLQKDILNDAISGGGFEGSFLNYVLSGAYNNNPPKYIIWEFPAHDNINNAAFFRELLPALDGQCDAKTVLHTNSGIFHPGKFSLFSRAALSGTGSAGFYLSLEVNDPHPRDIRLRFSKSDGSFEDISLKRPPRIFPNPNKNYFAEFPEKRNLQSIEILDNKLEGKFKANLCPSPDLTANPVQVAEKPSVEKPDRNFLLSRVMAWTDKFLKDFKSKPFTLQETRPDPVHEKPVLPDLSPYNLPAIENKMPALSLGIAASGAAAGLLKDLSGRMTDFPAGEMAAPPIIIHQGHYDLPLLVKEINSPALVETDKAFILRAPLIIHPDASLTIKNILKPVLLSQDSGSYISSSGNLYIVNSELIAWNEAHQSPALPALKNKSFRPFITIWSGGELYAYGSVFKNLGFDHDKAYGISLSTSRSVENSFLPTHGKLKKPRSWLLNNRFENLHFGFYSYEAENTILIGNIYKNSTVYGIDPHDRTRGLIIANNKISGSGKHGIVLSREVNDSYIIGNNSFENKGSGIMLDRNCRGNVIAGNISRFNSGDGFSVYESPYNHFSDNQTEYNKGAGFRIRNSRHINVAGGNNAFNDDYAFIIYESDLKETKRDFVKDPVHAVSSVSIRDVQIGAQQKTFKAQGFKEINLANIGEGKNGLTFGGELSGYKAVINDFIKRKDGVRIVSSSKK